MKKITTIIITVTLVALVLNALCYLAMPVKAQPYAPFYECVATSVNAKGVGWARKRWIAKRIALQECAKRTVYPNVCVVRSYREVY